ADSRSSRRPQASGRPTQEACSSPPAPSGPRGQLPRQNGGPPPRLGVGRAARPMCLVGLKPFPSRLVALAAGISGRVGFVRPVVVRRVEIRHIEIVLAATPTRVNRAYRRA